MTADLSLLNDNLAHKLVLALLQEDAVQAASYTQLLGQVQQVLSDVRAAHAGAGSVPPETAVLTATDALAITSGCIDNSGGYRNDTNAAMAFRRGLIAVENAIRAKMFTGKCTFEHALAAAEYMVREHRPTRDDDAYGNAVYDGANTAFLRLSAASRNGLSDPEVLAAHRIGTLRPLVPAAVAHTVSGDRGEDLLAQLEEGIASPPAQALRSHILAGQKEDALAILAEERMVGKDAEDLYAYCRQKWLGKRLALVEVPFEQMEEIVRKNLPSNDEFAGYGPDYLVRRGNAVANGYATERNGRLWLHLSRDRVEVKDIPQLWMVVEQP